MMKVKFHRLFLFVFVLMLLMPSLVSASKLDGIRKKKKVVRKTSSVKKVVVPAKLAMTCNGSLNVVEIVAYLPSPKSIAQANQISLAVKMLVKDGEVTTTNLVATGQPLTDQVSSMKFVVKTKEPLQYENAWSAYMAVADSLNSKVGIISSSGCIDLLRLQVAAK